MIGRDSTQPPGYHTPYSFSYFVMFKRPRRRVSQGGRVAVRDTGQNQGQRLPRAEVQYLGNVVQRHKIPAVDSGYGRKRREQCSKACGDRLYQLACSHAADGENRTPPLDTML